MFLVVVDRVAELQLELIMHYYEDQQIGLGHKCIEEMNRSFVLLSKFSHARPEEKHGLRLLQLDTFAASVAYRIYNTLVVVHFIFDSRSDFRKQIGLE